MIGFAEIASGDGPSSAGAMTDHLLNNTLSIEGAKLAAYYTNGMVKNATLDLALAVAAGEADFNDAVDSLVEKHARDNGIGPPTRAEVEALGRDGRGAEAEDLQEQHERKMLDIEGQYSYRLDVLVDRLKAGLLDAPLGVVRPDIHPLAARGLGIEPDGLLAKKEINALLTGRRTDGEKVEGKIYAVARKIAVNPKDGVERYSTPIGSYDFCPTPDKSVSVAWAFAPPVEQAQIYTAHIEAAREAVGLIAAKVGVAGIGKQGREGSEPGHVAWLEFSHHTSRPTMISVQDGEVKIADKGAGEVGDPDIHTHFLIPNAVFCESGRVGSLDTMAIRGFLMEADSFYHARLAQKLRDAGFATELDHTTGAVRMSAVPDDVRTLFSKRTLAGELLAKKHTAERGEVWEELSEEQRVARMKAATQDRDQKTKGEKDPEANFADWRRQAKEIAGWEPVSLQLYGPSLPELSVEQRHRVAYEVGLPFLAEKLEHKSVVTHWDVRVAANRGLIQAGISDGTDTDAVTRIMREEGVQQYGERTGLVWGLEDGKRYTSVTTALHERDEQEFIRLTQAASHDRSGAIPARLLNQKIAASGLDFSGTHGRAQRAAIERLGTGGKFSVMVASAGAGKTASLKSLVASWQEQSRPVWGASLAWRQADDLVDAGIDRHNVKAFSVLIDGVRNGSIGLHSRSVVAVDEWGLLGTRQALELLRLRDKHGFTIVALGDERQCQAISAGAVVDLSRRALGAEQIPEILTTVRQQTERERTIVGLFREGRAAEALTMKRSDGTAEMAFGGYAGVVDRVAALYAERLKASGSAPTISAPTNSDAHQISEAVRIERRKLGIVGPDLMTIKATDGERNYAMRLAKGDQVRLFKSTGSKRGGTVGRNGSLLEVIDATDRALTLKGKSGKVGEVAWGDLRHSSGRTLLAYGDVLTIHTAQGSTAAEHIFALPAGSQAIDGNLSYTANTRHRQAAYIVTSDAAETTAVRKSRPINEVRPVSLDDKWAAVAKSMAYQPVKDTALAMFERAHQIRRGAVKAFHKSLLPAEQQQAAGQAPSMGHEVAMTRRVTTGLAQEAAAIVQRVATYARQVQQRMTPEHRQGRGPERGPTLER